MSKTLIVSDNEILNQLYLINLEVYLATDATLVLSTTKAMELLLKDNKFDLIITMNMINGQDSAAAMYEFLEDNNIVIPLVIVGSPAKEIPNITVVPSSFNLQNLLRSCAELLKVTAKSMATLEVPEYFGVNTKFLMRLRESPCSIYIQMKKIGEENNFTMIAKKGSSLSEVLKKFSDEGIDTLFVNRLDRLIVINQVSKILCDFIKETENLGMVEKSTALQAGFDFAASEFCLTPEVAKEIVGIAGACTKVMGEIVNDTPGLKALIGLLNDNKSGYIYTHSILASYIASHIVRKVAWGGEGHIEKINFVLFFHDIMLAPIYLKHPTLKYEEDLLFSDQLSDKEKDIVLNHARLAAEIIITYKRAPMGVDLLIKQHHGMTNGIGFALEFKDDVSPLSKIVLVSEAFVEEYMKAKEADAKYQIDLKKILLVLVEKFKKSTYKKIIETLETLQL
jgi:HD-GYP domain-containing protein (c-di-GMP phosphodiesterase class II)